MEMVNPFPFSFLFSSGHPTGLASFGEGLRNVLESKTSGSKRGRGRPAKIPLVNLLCAQTLRMMKRSGSVAECHEAATGRKLAGSCISRRIRRVDYETLQQINDVVLQPKATPERHPEAYWKGWKPVGIDGTTFSLQNCGKILEDFPKHSNKSKKKNAQSETSRGGQYGFSKINACALVELGTHAPLAAEIGLNREGELTLAYRLIGKILPGMLLLADSLYGCGAFLQPLHHHCRRVGAAFVIRVLPAQTTTTLRELGDGSRLVEVGIRSRKRPEDIVEVIVVREVTYTVASTDENGNPTQSTCRLWTNLLDPKHYPALELATLITHRWEHEIYYGEAKSMLRHEYLESQLPETAAVEIMALLWASSLLAEARAEVALTGSEPTETVRVSFSKTRQSVEKLLWLICAGRGILTDTQTEEIIAKEFNELRERTLKPRRSRRCPRKVRRKQTHWPKLIKRSESKSRPTITLAEQAKE